MSITPSTPRIDTIETETTHAYNRPTTNYLINGALDFWQRGDGKTLSTSAGTYIADRFRGEAAGSSAYTCTKITDVPNSKFSNAMHVAQVGVGSGYTAFAAQILEASTVAPLIGREVTFSVWARGTNPATLRVRYPDALNSWANRVHLYNEVVTTGSLELDSVTWTRLSVTFTVPEGCVNGMGVILAVVTTGQGDWFDATGFQLETGSSATEFVRAGGTLTGELALCQRYYETCLDVNAPIGSVSTNYAFCQHTGSSNRVMMQSRGSFAVTKRAAPVVQIYSGANANGIGLYNSSTVLLTSTAVSMDTLGIHFITVTTTPTAGTLYACNWAADAEL